MQLIDSIDTFTVCIDTTSQSKTAVLLKLSQVLSQRHAELDADLLFDAYWKRECMGSTAIGHGIVIPHIRSSLIKKTCACLLKLQNPVDFGAMDKQPIDLVIGMIVPEQQTDQHLQTLAKISKQCSDPLFRNACHSAKDSETLYDLLMLKKRVTSIEEATV